MAEVVLEKNYEDPGLLPPVASIYDKKSVFITSVDCAVGKVLVEKLLYSVPGIQTIFVLDYGTWETLAKDVIFDRVRVKDAKLLEKVVPVRGVSDDDKLGLSDEDYDRISQEASIVFHTAAVTRIRAELRDDLDRFYKISACVIQMCRQMPKLECFCHVSSAYANCGVEGERSEERLYPSPWMPGDDMGGMHEAIDKFSDVYTFNHNLLETQVKHLASQVPSLIVRPSSIDAIHRENVPGWTDDFSALSLCAGWVGTGSVRMIHSRRDIVIETVPVDYVVNMIIVAAAARIRSSENGVPVMHCTSGSFNPVTLGRIIDSSTEFFLENPLESALFTPGLLVQSRAVTLLWNCLLTGYIPQLAYEWWQDVKKRQETQTWTSAILAPYKPAKISYSVYRPLCPEEDRMIGGAKHFFSRSWEFETKERPKLWARLSSEDQDTFHFDMRAIDLEAYLTCQYWGIRKYLFKEDKDNLERARAHLQRLRKRQNIGQLSLAAVVLLLLTLYDPRLLLWLAFIIATLFAGAYAYKKLAK